MGGSMSLCFDRLTVCQLVLSNRALRFEQLHHSFSLTAAKTNKHNIPAKRSHKTFLLRYPIMRLVNGFVYTRMKIKESKKCIRVSL